jgi:hypothetical protein
MPNEKLGNKNLVSVIKDNIQEKKMLNKKPNIEKYASISANDLSAKELKWGLWQTSHRMLLYKILFGVLIALIVLFWGYSVWGWVNYFLGMTPDKMVQASLTQSIDYTYYHQQFGAKPLQINSLQSFNSGVDKYDAVAEIQNPNDNFIVFLSYSFSVNGTSTMTQSTFLLPGESRPIAIMGLKSSSDIGTPVLNMQSLTWQRITTREVSDPKSWQLSHLNFVISSSTFIKASASGASADIIRFSLTNESPYDYYAPFFYVGLYQSGSLADILPLYFDSFKSAEVKKVDLRSLAPSLQVTEVVVYPIINIYNKDAYLFGNL